MTARKRKCNYFIVCYIKSFHYPESEKMEKIDDDNFDTDLDDDDKTGRYSFFFILGPQSSL